MTERVPLVEHRRPRILTIDFSSKDAQKISKCGFNVREGTTGIFPPGKYSIPWAIQDVEIVFINCIPGAFSRLNEREKAEDSIEDGPNFHALITQVWRRDGWTVIFLQQGCSPEELDLIALRDLGVLYLKGNCLPVTWLKNWKEIERKVGPPPVPTFPKFVGQAVELTEYEPERKLLKRYLNSARFSRLCRHKGANVAGEERYSEDWLITDESADSIALAIKLKTWRGGGVLILPDFADRNVDVAIDLLQNVFPEEKPSLYDAPHHPWLKDFLPHSVMQVRREKVAIITRAKDQLDKLDKLEEEELTKYAWLNNLLVGTGDSFRDAVAKALKFLDFDAKVIDEELNPGQRKREDLRIRDSSNDFFALVEAKTTRRGASEDFITDTQNHQGTYSRENNCSIPRALLIVNHSYELHPDRRDARFYTDPEVHARCVEQLITALDSVTLHHLCQAVLCTQKTKEEARRFLKTGQGVLCYEKGPEV